MINVDRENCSWTFWMWSLKKMSSPQVEFCRSSARSQNTQKGLMHLCHIIIQVNIIVTSVFKCQICYEVFSLTWNPFVFFFPFQFLCEMMEACRISLLTHVNKKETTWNGLRTSNFLTVNTCTLPLVHTCLHSCSTCPFPTIKLIYLILLLFHSVWLGWIQFICNKYSSSSM